MVFSSLTFLYFFLPITLLVYYVSPKKVKNFILLVSSLAFYAWGEPIYILAMIFSASVDYVAGRIMDINDDNQKARNICLVFSVCMNIGLLAIFKYSSFFVENINSIFDTRIANPNLPLPIGISFYTFQSMSYIIDLYRRKVKVQKNLIDFMAYVTMFPQIIAGPIVTYNKLEEKLKNRKVTLDYLSDGVAQFVKGLGKKVLLANNIGMMWEQVKSLNYSNMSAATAWLGIIAFAFQIYFEFSGFSDMALGLGKMLGFDFPKNFNLPYTATSITNFWKSWNITLGAWFRKYLYIPLGGKHKGTLKTIRNILITWIVIGFWYGAGWNFAIWGLYFGVLIILEKFVCGKYLEKLPKIINKLYTFLLVLFGWVIFNSNSIFEFKKYIGAMFGFNGLLYDRTTVFLIVNYAFIFTICVICSGTVVSKISNKLDELKIDFRSISAPIFQLGIMLLSTAYLVNQSYNPFLIFKL
ncbi:MAG: MBOAT family protein [Clostridiales bacterium]|nr:MBOAT family protein [Clostridiales bacterium]